MSEKKKMGRPVVGQPKDIRLTIRINQDTLDKLNQICAEKKISQSECIRQLINKE